MPISEDLDALSAAANDAAGAKLREARSASDPKRAALLAEARRLTEQANRLTRLALDWTEGRAEAAVSALARAVAEERRAQSDIAGRLRAVLTGAVRESGVQSPTQAAVSERTPEADTPVETTGTARREAPLEPEPERKLEPVAARPAPEPAAPVSPERPPAAVDIGRGPVLASNAAPAASAPEPAAPPVVEAPPAPPVAVETAVDAAEPRIVASPDPDRRETRLALLHPEVRGRVERLIAALDAAGVPMTVFESFRSPERQRMLFAKGRRGGAIVDRGRVVTFADAWRSLHQYGLAVDMVIDRPGVNPWETRGEAAGWWDAYHRIARDCGLEPLDFEKPHVQLRGADSAALGAGRYPEGGDAGWSENLGAVIGRWREAGAPPAPGRAIDWSGLPPIASTAFSNPFDGQRWRVDGRGVYLETAPGAALRTPGAPVTASRILALYGAEIEAAARRRGVAPELLVMTVATEAGAFRDDGFTGPKTFRWEAHFRVGHTGDPRHDGVTRGDYSAGPAQLMADTARWLNDVEGLGHDAETFRFFEREPTRAPDALGLYDPAISLDLAACYIARGMARTGGDPLLAAAAYNAGSVRESDANPWRIHVHGDHLDRAARWFGDACAAMGRSGG